MADMFALTSLVLPDWIVTEVGGDMRLGLMMSCVTLHKRPAHCFPPSLPWEWMLSLMCVIMGVVCVTTTLILILMSAWRRTMTEYAKRRLVEQPTSCLTHIRLEYHTFSSLWHFGLLL